MQYGTFKFAQPDQNLSALEGLHLAILPDEVDGLAGVGPDAFDGAVWPG